MSISARREPLPVIEMKLVHDVHRAAASLLAAAATRPGAPSAELAELRDFVVAALRHHHQSEDDALWPVCEEVDPQVAAGLEELSSEHRELDEALDALGAVPVETGADRAPLAAAAEAVRELVHDHLAHEEPVTLPALRLLTAVQWAEFSRVAMESAPTAGVHLQIGLMDEVGDPGDVTAVLAGLPAPVARTLPAMRKQAQATLDAVRGAS